MTQIQSTNQNEQFPVKALFDRPAVREKFSEMLGNRSTAFLTTVLQIVNSNDLLREADPQSVYSAAMTAATLNLPVNQNLGFAYIIPYRDTRAGKTFAQFQIGYRGIIQLAQRSGLFKTINVSDVREGEIAEYNRLSGEITFRWHTVERDKFPVIGYISYFSLLNGFEKSLYMSIDELKQHGIRYSKSFAKGYGLWKDDFDAMARKTVMKLLLARFAPLSVEMQKAVISDQAIIMNPENDEVVYVDNYQSVEITIEMVIAEFEAKRKQLSHEDIESIERIIENNEVKSFEKVYKMLSELPSNKKKS